ncbi:MAG: hypothetical protein ACYSUI_10200 [Planctomycetota bacterium]|jgi:hypothetical protein
MSKQIRIDEDAYECLERLVGMTGKRKSLCASLIIESFEKVLTELGDDGKLWIKKGDSTDTAFLLPLTRRREV